MPIMSTKFGPLGEIRTPGLRFRKPALYPTELRADKFSILLYTRMSSFLEWMTGLEPALYGFAIRCVTIPPHPQNWSEM